MKISNVRDIKKWILANYPYLNPRKFEVNKTAHKIHIYFVGVDNNLYREIIFSGNVTTFQSNLQNLYFRELKNNVDAVVAKHNLNPKIKKNA